MIGLGCMRLSTAPTRNEERAIEVIHSALNAGATLLDTADAYCFDDTETGHNERLIARALRSWSGDRSTIEVATKGGLRRPGGSWVPDGRAQHLRAACEASRRALAVDVIDLYQLHAVDPRTAIETSVRALAALKNAGTIRRIGLCNVNVGQIETARRITDIDSVQVSLSVLDEENVRNGVAACCRRHGIRLIAYRPLSGERSIRLSQDPVLRESAEAHGATAQEIALAWLLDLDPNIVPIPGATRIETASSIARVLTIKLSEADRAALDARFGAGKLLREADTTRRPAEDATGEVVLVMGMPGAGKSTVARELCTRGWTRLNRDEAGGKLSGLVTELDQGLAAGQRQWVLDNTYAARRARNEVIECAWRHGVPVRCVWLTTNIADAQINAINRLLEAHGGLPMPEELRKRGKTDHRYFGPDAQFRYERQLEPPTLEEGFSALESRTFERHPQNDFTGKALLLEYDGVLCTSASGAAAVLQPDDIVVAESLRETLGKYLAEGWLLLASAWRPQIAQGITTEPLVQACFQRTRELLGLPIDLAFCPHPPGPPVCWCRKPLPGLPLQFAHRHQLDLTRCIMVGRARADETMARRLGMALVERI